jgi:Arc/MetJ-type ribon-helix-helix transcriptional regulator
VLVLYMSANAFGSEWAQLESHTFRFRDPLNMCVGPDRNLLCLLLTPRSTSVRSWDIAMDVTLPADLREQVEQELASGHYQSSDQLIEQAVRHFLDDRQRAQRRLDSLRRIGQAVDRAGLYERVLLPGQQ